MSKQELKSDTSLVLNILWSILVYILYSLYILLLHEENIVFKLFLKVMENISRHVLVLETYLLCFDMLETLFLSPNALEKNHRLFEIYNYFP